MYVVDELIDEARKNFKVKDDGMATKAHASLAKNKNEKGTSVDLVPIKVNAFAGKGVALGANVAAVEHRSADGETLKIAKVGANCGVSNRGVNVSVEAKPLWTESTHGNTRVGAGLSLDTGLKVNADGFDVSFLGIGMKCGDDGFGIKLPFLNLFWKD